MKISTVYINPGVDTTDAQGHVDAAELWLSAAELVASSAKNEQALSLISSFVTNAAVCKPAEQSVIPIQGPEQPSIFIVPIMPGEEELSDTTRMLTITKSQGARFTENTPGRIYFDGSLKMNNLWLGLILVHELQHAENYLQGKYPSDHSEHWEEEVDVFMFEHLLLRSIGGDEYESFVGDQIQRVKAEYLRTIYQAIPPITGLEKLDNIFAKALSDDETRARTSVIFLDVVFRMFDELFPDESRSKKTEFLKSTAISSN